MIEWVLLSIVVPIGRKLGERWIDRVVEGLDKSAIDLVKRLVDGDIRTDDAVRQLESDARASSQITSNVAAFLEEDVTVESLGVALGVPSRGSRLVYIEVFLNWIADAVTKSERDVVLEGFLHSELAVTLFKIDDSRLNSERWTFSPATKSLNVSSFGPLSIRVAGVGSIDERSALAAQLEREIVLSDYGSLPIESWGTFLKRSKEVESFRDRFFVFKDVVRFDTGGERQFYLENHRGIDLLADSLRATISAEVEELQSLVSAVKHAITTPETERGR